MSLDLSVRYDSESKIDKDKYRGFLSEEYYDEDDEECYLDDYGVSLDYRLTVGAIQDESRFMCMQLNAQSILSLLTCFEGWSGFNGEMYKIRNTGNSLFFERGDYERTEVVAELKEKDLEWYKENVYRAYDEVEKYLQTDSSDYIANKNFFILEMLKDLLENKKSYIYANFD